MHMEMLNGSFVLFAYKYLPPPPLLALALLNPLHIVPQHEIFNNVVCATSKDLDKPEPAHMHSLIKAFASRLNILQLLRLLIEHHLEFLCIKWGCTGTS